MKKKKPGLPQKSRGLEHFQHRDEFGKLLGYRIQRLDRKKQRAVFTLEVRRDHLSPFGRVHGGVLSACFDATLGVAVFATLGPRDFAATVELKINYLRPLALGDRVKIDAKVVFRGRRLAVAQGFLYANGSRQPAAMAVGTFMIVSEARMPARATVKSATSARRPRRVRDQKV